MSATPYVEFECDYVPRIAGGATGRYASEIYPLRVDVHGTHQLAHVHAADCVRPPAQIVVIARQSDSHSFRVLVERHAATSNESGLWMPYYEAGAYATPIDVARSADTGSVAASTAVMLHMYATTYTETRQQCWTSIGTAVVPLATLMAAARTGTDETVEVVQNRDNEQAAVRHNNPLLKGRCRLSKIRVVGITLRATTRYDIDVGGQRAADAAALMCGVIDRGMLAFFGTGQMRAMRTQCAAFLGRTTRPFLRPFHCPEFRTDRMPLPASAYAMLMPCGAPCVAYYERLLDVALARSGGLTRADAARLGTLALAQEGARHERAAFASVCVRAMTAFAVSQCYLDDFLNRNVAGEERWRAEAVEGDEDFKICRLCGGDDCEGCALEVHMHMRSLTRASPDGMSPLLQLVRRYLRLYVSTLTLGAVTNKKLTASELNQSSVMAHTFAVFVPYWQLYGAAGDVAREALERSRFYAERRQELAAYREAPLAALVGEGTASIDPAAKPVSAYYDDKRTLADALATAAARRNLTQQVVDALAAQREENVNVEVFGAPDTATGEDYSPFYKYPVSFAAADFADLRTLDWAWVYRRDSADERTFGVEFRDIVDPPPATRPRADIIPFVDINDEEARTIDAILLDQQPIPVLRVAPADYRSPAERRYEPALAALARTGTVTGGTVLHPRRLFLTLRDRDVNDNTLAALRRIAALPAVRAFEYRWWTLNAAVDGTDRHNTVLDVYLSF